MKDKRADISQIKAYLDGKLDSKAMHRLEREAQADPFLADAMEGYAGTADQQANLAALQQRLQERIEPKVRRLVPWTTIAVAASVVGFMIIAGLFFLRDDSKQPSPKVAANEPAKSAALIDSNNTRSNLSAEIAPPPPAVVSKPMAGAQHYAPPQEPVLAGRAADKAIVPAAPVVQAEANKTPAADSVDDAIAGYMAAKRQDTILGGENIAINKKPSEITVLKTKAEGATYKERERQSAGATALLANSLPPGFSGKVLDKSNGLPIPGASVQVVGKPEGTVTDVNGRFNLREVKPEDKVAINFIGYNSKVLPAKAGDTVKVSLDQNTNSLAEVVTVGYASAPKRSGSKAAPVNGWKAYTNYLKQQAILPSSEKAGSVELTFTVEPNGTISDIKPTKSLNPDADMKAIKIIQTGPRWFGNLNGKPEVVRVTVKFVNRD